MGSSFGAVEEGFSKEVACELRMRGAGRGVAEKLWTPRAQGAGSPGNGWVGGGPPGHTCPSFHGHLPGAAPPQSGPPALITLACLPLAARDSVSIPLLRLFWVQASPHSSRPPGRPPCTSFPIGSLTLEGPRQAACGCLFLRWVN